MTTTRKDNIDVRKLIELWAEPQNELTDVVVGLGLPDEQENRARISGLASRLRKNGIPLRQMSGKGRRGLDYEELASFYADLTNGAA